MLALKSFLRTDFTGYGIPPQFTIYLTSEIAKTADIFYSNIDKMLIAENEVRFERC